MANGRRFDRRALTAASYAYPLGTVLEVVDVKNRRRVVVMVTDRGPKHRLKRLLDLSEGAAKILDIRGQGVIKVRVLILKYRQEPHIRRY